MPVKSSLRKQLRHNSRRRFAEETEDEYEEAQYSPCPLDSRGKHLQKHKTEE
jgi:hypothetical protein